MKRVSGIIQHLQAVRQVVGHNRALMGAGPQTHLCREDLVLTRGRLFNYQTGRIPPTQTGRRLGYCYMNAWEMVSRDPHRFSYCEGFVTVFGLPIEHAWVTDDGISALDPTFEGAEAGGASPEYFGVIYDYDFMRRALLEQGYYGLLAGQCRLSMKRLRDWLTKGVPGKALCKRFSIPSNHENSALLTAADARLVESRAVRHSRSHRQGDRNHRRGKELYSP